MPSAQYEEKIEQPLVVTTDYRRAELQSFLHAINTTNISNLKLLHRRGRILFAEGEAVRGIYILRAGRAAVSISSSEGRVVMLRVAQAGDVLGLNSVLQNCPYETTVKTLESCRTDFISSVELLEIMEMNHAASQAILKILSRELAELTQRARSLLLQQTAGARLAQLLLEWTNGNASSTGRIDRIFTHEEMARMICSSRETVTRLLAAFTKQQLISITPDSILISDRGALEKMAAG